MKFRSFTGSARRITKWADLIVLIAACLAYIGIASLFLGTESSYFDEGFTSFLARFSPLEIAHYTALDVHPPLYYIVLHYWQLVVGIDVFSLRFLSVLWGVVAIIFAFLIARRSFGRMAAWSTLFFVILSPLFIRYSEAMRMYTMALAIVAAATYLLILLSDPRTRRRKLLWGTYAVLVSAGMWTNYFTIFIWLAHLGWVASGPLLKASNKLSKDAKDFIKQWYWAIGIAVLLYLPWLPWLVVRFTDIQTTGFWIKPISVDTIVSTVTTATTYKSAALTTGWLVVLICLYVGLAVFCGIRAYRAAAPKQRVILRLLLLCGLVPIVGLILLSLPPLRSSFVYRYVLNGVFMMTIVMGISFALVSFTRRPLAKKIALYGLALAVLGSGAMAVKAAGNRSLDTGVKNMVAQAVERIHQSSPSGAPIVSRSPYTYYTAALYETPSHPVYYTFSHSLSKVGSTHMLYDHPEKRGIMDLAKFANQHKKIWIIAEDKHSAMKSPAPDWKQGQSFTLYDSASGLPTAYGSEYIKP